jgi:hypothetical protein
MLDMTEFLALDSASVIGADSNTAPSIYKSELRVVGTHLDWLTCSVTRELPSSLMSALYAALGGSNGKALQTPWTFLDEPVYLRTNSTGNIVLHNDYIDIRTVDNKGDTCAMVTLYSPAFWEYGDRTAVERFQAFVDMLWEMPPSERVTLKPSRVDLCRDTQGFRVSTIGSYDAVGRDFVTHFRSVSFEGKTEAQTVYLGRAGKSAQLRIYNKSAELIHKPKDYYFPTWRANGWVPSDEVTRIEFQLNSQFFREWEVAPERRIADVWQLLDAINGIWHYLTVEHTRMIVPDESETNTSRLQTAPFWLLVAAEFAPTEVNAPGNRWTRRLLQREGLEAQMVGVFRSYLALTPGGEDYESEEYTRGFLRMISNYEKRHGESFARLVEQRHSDFFAGLAA